MARSAAHTLPPQFLERLSAIYPPRLVETILPMFSLERPTTFRINTLLADRYDVRRALHEEGFRSEAVPWCAEAFILRNRTGRELTETAAYRAGHIYVQGLSSMLPPLMLAPQSGMTVLDLTAAPGSKTTQMAALMQNQGQITANDNNKPRFFRLLANVQMQAATCVECIQTYGETVWRRYGEAFDAVLLDAPCSAEGRFQTDEPSTYRYWKPRKVTEMMRKQKRLLYSAIRALKPGGTLVYSTCTFAPEENEAVVSWAATKFADAVELEPCRPPVTNILLPLTSWKEKAFVPAIRHAVRVMPTATMDAFFIAKLRKHSSIV